MILAMNQAMSTGEVVLLALLLGLPLLVVIVGGLAAIRWIRAQRDDGTPRR